MRRSPGNLDDYAFFIWGLLELYAAGFDEGRLGQALHLSARMLQLFSGPGGGLYFTPSDGEELIARSVEYHDGAYPSGNSIAFCVLVRLARLTGDPAWESAARAILRGAAADVRRHPAGYGMLLAGIHAAPAGSRETVLAGDPASPALREMLDRARRAYMPDCTIIVKRPGSAGTALSAVAPFTAAMKAPEEGAAAYVCTGRLLPSARPYRRGAGTPPVPKKYLIYFVHYQQYMRFCRGWLIPDFADTYLYRFHPPEPGGLHQCRMHERTEDAPDVRDGKDHSGHDRA